MTPAHKDKPAKEKRIKQIEGIATFGLILICVALVAPFTDPGNTESLKVFRWIYGSGAIIYTIARIFTANDPEESLQVKRIRRMEFWAGISFLIATGFWFYEQHHLGQYAGTLAIMKNTILFTLVGAIIQIISVWLLYSRQKKELKK